MPDEKSELLKQAEAAFLNEDRDQAERLARKALEQAEGDADVLKTIRALEYLAYLIMTQHHREDEYKSLGERAAKLRECHASDSIRSIESKEGPNHPDMIKPLIELARVYATKLYEGRHELPGDTRELDGLYDKALGLHDRAQSISRSAFGEESERHAEYLMVRARFFSFETGSPKPAIELRRRALQIFERTDPASKNSRMAKHSLAFALAEANMLDEAAKAYEEILAKEAGDRTNTSVRALLGMVYKRMGRTEESLEILRQVEAVDEVTLAAKPYLNVSHAWHLAGDLVAAGKLREAEAQFRKTLAWNAQAPDDRLSMRGLIQRDFAQCLCDLGHAEEAVAMAKEGLTNVEAELGAGHYHTAASLRTLCNCLHLAGDEDEVPALVCRMAEVLIALPYGQLSRDEGLREDCVRLLQTYSQDSLAKRLQERIATMSAEWQPPS